MRVPQFGFHFSPQPDRGFGGLAVDIGEKVHIRFVFHAVDVSQLLAALDVHIIHFKGLIQGLAQYYRATGFEPARELAAQLARGFVDHGTYYDRQGHFMLYDGQGQPAIDAEGRPVYGGHFHAHSIGLLSVLEYALAAHDNRMLAFVHKSFEWARLQGSPLVGYFPEQINNVLEFVIPPYWDTVEICEVADMIGLAVKLSAAGAGDYWDDVDRWARNHFFECQLTKSDWVYRIPRKNNSTPVEPNQSTNRVAERNIGAFSGFASGSDWGVRMGIMHCCTGNAVRAIYYIWENILQEKAGALALNLLLNRAAPQADVYSHLPYQGRVDIKAKQPFSNVLVRAPEWIASGSAQVKVKVNNQAVTSGWRGRYISAGPVNAGDTVTVIFPIRERVLKERLGDTIYTLIIRGNTVVAIDPPGRYCPIYQRDHYRQDHVLWHTVDRFVCDETVEW